MINSTFVETKTVGIKRMFLIGKIDDTATVTPFSLAIDYDDLTAPQKTTFDNFSANIIKSESNMSIINLPNTGSVFSIDYVTDSLTMVNGVVDYDYTALSPTSQGYIDAFHQLILDLL